MDVITTRMSLDQKKVLIVDDERALAKALELKLFKEGIDASAVFDGQEALAELALHSYDLILLDLMMPLVDGWEVMEKMKEMQYGGKVVVTSNLSQEEDQVRARSLGAIDFLVKSDATISSIVEEVKSYL